MLRTKKKNIILVFCSAVLVSLAVALITYSSNGYQWQCLDDDGYISHVHHFSNTAITKANAHAAKYGHKVTIYELEQIVTKTK